MLVDGCCCMIFPLRWEEEEAVELAPAVKTLHLEVAGSPVLYTWYRTYAHK